MSAVLVGALLSVVSAACGSGPAGSTNAARAGSSTTTSRTPAPSTTEEGGHAGPGASTVSGPVVASGSGSRTGADACRSGDPLINVYHPDRLKVVSPCTTVTGVVRSVRTEPDGDTHFDLQLDPAYTHLLTPASYSLQHDWLVAEIVPADEPGCTPGTPPRPPTGTYDYGVCTGADESPPALGSRVAVTGPYVLDEVHEGWAEIHPVWAVSGPAAPSP